MNWLLQPCGWHAFFKSHIIGYLHSNILLLFGSTGETASTNGDTEKARQIGEASFSVFSFSFWSFPFLFCLPCWHLASVSSLMYLPVFSHALLSLPEFCTFIFIDIYEYLCIVARSCAINLTNPRSDIHVDGNFVLDALNELDSLGSLCCLVKSTMCLCASNFVVVFALRCPRGRSFRSSKPTTSPSFSPWIVPAKGRSSWRWVCCSHGQSQKIQKSKNSMTKKGSVRQLLRWQLFTRWVWLKRPWRIARATIWRSFGGTEQARLLLVDLSLQHVWTMRRHFWFERIAKDLWVCVSCSFVWRLDCAKALLMTRSRPLDCQQSCFIVPKIHRWFHSLFWCHPRDAKQFGSKKRLSETIFHWQFTPDPVWSMWWLSRTMKQKLVWNMAKHWNW